MESEALSVERLVASRGKWLDGSPDELWDMIPAEGLAQDDHLRRYARAALKRSHVPDRLVTDVAGTTHLELLDVTVWRPFDFGVRPWSAPVARK